MSSTAAAPTIASGSAPAAVVPPLAVTTWRLQLAAKVHDIAQFIAEHAEPEMRFHTASNVGRDIVQAVKSDLRRNYGRVFDPLIDGPEPNQA